MSIVHYYDMSEVIVSCTKEVPFTLIYLGEVEKMDYSYQNGPDLGLGLGSIKLGPTYFWAGLDRSKSIKSLVWLVLPGLFENF